MAEFAINHLIISGSGKTKFINEINRLEQLPQGNGEGLQPFGIGQDYWFTIWTDGESISYETKYTDNVNDVVAIARRFRFSFVLSSEEFCYGHFAEYRYDVKENLFEMRCLSAEILDEIESLPDGYLFRGENWDSRSELCELLIRQVQWEKTLPGH